MGLSAGFRRTAAICWIATGVTTLGLIFLPRMLPPVTNLASRAQAWTSAIALVRLWVGVVHPLLAMTAALGIAAALAPRAPWRAVTAFLSLFVWGVCETIQQSLLLVGLTWTLYPRYLATDAATRPDIAASIAAVSAVSDALFFVILLAFVAGHVLFASAMPKVRGFDRLVTAIFVLAAGLGVVSFLTRFGNGVLPAQVMDVLYPLIQPAGRALTGIWLWRDRSMTS